MEITVDWSALPWGLDKKRGCYSLAENEDKSPAQEELENDCTVEIKSSEMRKGSSRFKAQIYHAPYHHLQIQSVLFHYLNSPD